MAAFAHVISALNVDPTLAATCIQLFQEQGFQSPDDFIGIRECDFEEHLIAMPLRAKAVTRRMIRHMASEGSVPAPSPAPAPAPSQSQAPTHAAPGPIGRGAANASPVDLNAPTTSSFNGPTVVMLGGCGHGKSTIVEKVTGVSGFSSNSDESFTRVAQAVIAQSNDIQLIDTPGNNAMDDRMMHLIHVAHALNYADISALLVVVKAHVRLDDIMHEVTNQTSHLLSFSNLVVICVTHVDQARRECPTWDEARCKQKLHEKCGFNRSILVGESTSGSEIKQQLLSFCGRPQKILVNSENFLKFFNLNSGNNARALNIINELVAIYQQKCENFKVYLTNNTGDLDKNEKRDLVFEFHQYMSDAIPAAQSELTATCGFNIEGFTELEVGHLANLANRMRHILLDVRILMTQYQPNTESNNDLRKCPRCGIMWAKFYGCEGMTTCGAAHGVQEVDGDFRDSKATFRFGYVNGSLTVAKNPNRATLTHHAQRSGGYGKGCGASISWKEMAPVSKDEIIPGLGITVAQFMREIASEHIPSVEDVAVIQAERQQHWGAYMAQQFARIRPMQVTDMAGRYAPY